jgi:poly(3-hydroxybutyrate) depolymerase
MHFILENDRGHNFNKTPYSEEILERHVKYYGCKDVTTQYGRLIEKSLIINSKDRQYIVHEYNNQLTERLGLLLFYHGSRGTGWMSSLEYTRWIEYARENKLLIIFGQAQGEQVYPHKHKYYNHVTHGELYFEIRDCVPGFQDDIQYTIEVIKAAKSLYNIDDNRIYFVGHSNGGVFGCLLPIYLPNIFKGIVSHMGGIGHDPHFYLDFSRLLPNNNKTPILFYTGEHDVHRFPCEAAHSLFLAEKFPIVDIHIEDGLDHTYSYNCEPYILNWFNNLP